MSILVGAIVDNPPAKRRASDPARIVHRYVPATTGPMATYDAVSFGDESRKHWANADSLSALWANSPGVRRVARNRSRYERANNGYLKNAVKTSRNDIVGTCPTRKSAAPNPDHAAWIDREFSAWNKAIGFGWKFRTAATAYKGDGEAVGVAITNPKLPTPVKADIKLIEAEQLASPLSIYDAMGSVKDRFGVAADFMADGILFDSYGNVTEYHILDYHPGDGYNTDPLAFKRYTPEFVLHWYERDRPGQVRGMPDTLTALPLCAMLRRFTLASLQAAEVQAAIAGVLETTNAPDDGSVDEIPGMEFERGTIPSLPFGYKFSGVESTQPTSHYGEFKGEVLAEQGAGMSQSYQQIARDSSLASYSGARLTKQEDTDDVEVEREDAQCFWAEPHFEIWRREAAVIPGYAPEGLDLTDPANAAGEWHFRGFGYIDPVKEVTATLMELKGCLTSLKAIYAKKGKDWKAEVDQIATEREYLASKSLTIEDVGGPKKQTPDNQNPADEENDSPTPAGSDGKPSRGGYAAWIR